MEITTRAATGVDLMPMVELIARQNSLPENRCLHAGETADELRQGLLAINPPFISTFTVAIALGEREGIQLSDGRLLGVIGGDLSLSSSRAWLWGPWVEDGFWGVVAAPLLDRFLWFTRELDRVDAYADVAASRLYQLLTAQRFGQPIVTHLYLAARGAAASPPEPTSKDATQFAIVSLPESGQADFIRMHEAIFPESASGTELAYEMGPERPIFAVLRDGRLLGYLAASIQVDPREGMVEYLGVAEEARGLGVGRALLRRALRWAFDERDLPQVALTVREANAQARTLYETEGFRLERTGVHLRRTK